MQFFHSIIQFNKDLLTKYYTPGYVEDTASTIKSKMEKKKEKQDRPTPCPYESYEFNLGKNLT